MGTILIISECIIPVIILGVVMAGAGKKLPVYEQFTEGAKKGINIVFELLPTLIGLLIGVGTLRASGLLDALCEVIRPVLTYISFPAEVFPVALIKLFSSSAATGLMLDIFSTFGADSYSGRLTALILSSTETLMYTISVYFLSVKVTKTKWTIPACLISIISGVVASLVITKIFWG